MAPNFLGPFWVRINYHGLLAPHSMTIPTKNWNPGTGSGTFDIWSGGVVSAATMIVDLVDKLKTQFNSDTGFDNYSIFKQLLPADDPQPVYSGAFVGKVGTNTSGGWASAVEKLFIARSSTFCIAKLTLLDAVSDNDFSTTLTMGVDEDALFAEWSSDAKGWCARDNSQVTTFLKITKNINQALRKEYNYT
jgi:hypothetical protein